MSTWIPITEFDPLPVREVAVGYWEGEAWLNTFLPSDAVECWPEYTHYFEVPELPEKPA
jgi:hypothetical protein